MAGLLDFIAGSSDPSTADPTTGLVEAQRRQLAYGILGQTGAALLAAGAPQMPGSGDQGRALAQLGQIPGNLAAQQSAMVNQNVAAQRAKVLQDKVAQEKAAQAYTETPEYQQMLSALPDVLKSQALVNLKAGNYTAATTIVGDYVKLHMQMQAAKAVADREANKAQVTHDAAGNPIAYYPVSGKVVPIGGAQDSSAAYGLGPSGGGPAAPPSGGGGQPLPDGTPTADAMPPGYAPPVAAGTAMPSRNPTYPHASISPTADYGHLFGVGPALGYVLGRAQGYVAPGSTNPELAMQNSGVAEYQRMKLGLLNEARSEGPNSRLKVAYQNIADTLPDIMTDAPTALKKLTAAKNSIASELQNNWQLFNGIATKPAEKAKLAQEIMSLRTHYDNVNMVIDSMSQAQGGTRPTPSAQSKSDGGVRRLRYVNGELR